MTLRKGTQETREDHRKREGFLFMISLLFLLSSLVVKAESVTPRWMRYPAISPNGKEVVFSYQGDLYKVSTKGGEALRLTTGEAYETQPIWSPDGKKIAFVSTRNKGSRDIYVMDANGGSATRVTTHSTSEEPQFFSPDGKYIYYTAHIQDVAKSALFPSFLYNELYKVPVEGGRTTLVVSTPVAKATLSSDGSFMLYEDIKGVENIWRKHHTSSVTKDIVHYDFKDARYTPLTTWKGEDRNPQLGADNNTYYFLSERDGTFNVYASSILEPSQTKQLTHFKEHPVRFLSISKTGLLLFSYDGDLYTLTPGKAPEKLHLTLQTDLEKKLPQPLLLRSGIRSTDVSADGKQVAFVMRGEIFVTSSDYETTKRITDTAEEERGVSFSPDGRALVYASRRNGVSDLYVARIVREEEKYFPYATLIKEEPLIKGDKSEKMHPQYSPDGTEIAFVKDRTKVVVYNLSSKKIREITDGSLQSAMDGGIDFRWSPDGKWLLLNITTNHHEPYVDVVLVDATVEHGTLHNLTNSGYFTTNPRFVMNGDAILYSSEQYGMRNHASWGSMNDAMLLFLNRETFDRFNLSKEEFELLNTSDEKKEDKKESKKKDEKNSQTKPIKVELEGIESRVVRLTPTSSSLLDSYVTNDGTKLYYLEGDDEVGVNFWVKDLREGSLKLLVKLKEGSFSLSPDAKGKRLFLFSKDAMRVMDLSSEKITSIPFRAEMLLRPDEERAFMYEYVCQEEEKRFYREDMHGVNWAKLTEHYQAFLPHISNNYDFSELLSELLGELNVSHTGSGYRPRVGALQTAELGLFLDYSTADGSLRVDEVVLGGPFDKAKSKVQAGDYLTALNGVKLLPTTDIFPLLEGKAGQNILVSFRSKDGRKEWDEVVKPIKASQLDDLLYQRWVKAREEEVDRLSNGRLGYVHIPSMSDDSFRPAYSKALGKYYQREGLLVDIRYNGGGRLHEDLEVFLSGEKYLTQEIRGKYYCDMPSRRWTKPSVMLTCEYDYSNAHGTPWVYQYMKLGKVVGMPVPGTMTSVNWVTLQDPSIYFGIPAVGYRTSEGNYLENAQLEPDVKVPLAYPEVLQGKDNQIEKAIKVLLGEIHSQKGE